MSATKYIAISHCSICIESLLFFPLETNHTINYTNQMTATTYNHMIYETIYFSRLDDTFSAHTFNPIRTNLSLSICINIIQITRVIAGKPISIYPYTKASIDNIKSTKHKNILHVSYHHHYR